MVEHECSHHCQRGYPLEHESSLPLDMKSHFQSIGLLLEIFSAKGDLIGIRGTTNDYYRRAGMNSHSHYY